MRLKATVLLVALLGAACGDDAPVGSPGLFPACTPIRQEAIAPVEGLVLPRKAHVFRSRPTGQRLTQVRGYIEMTPVQLRKFYERLQARPRYEFFLLEDEVIEAEVFFTDGTWRNFVRARTICTGRSELFVLIAPEDYGDKVKLPPRTASPSR